jgi:hypothetical protein
MSGQSRIILAQETLKGGKKGKDTFNAYASRVTKANSEVTGKENLGKGKKK